jgi:RNA polymerase sigma-70 factor (ECF subfamily)
MPCVAHDDDLALARAAASGDTTALAAVEAGSFAAARTHLRARKFADWIIDEAMQQTRVALLVHDDGPPGIHRYAGTGPLAAFVRVVAVRFALKVTPSHADEEIVDQLEGAVPTPELATLKATYGALVRDAVLSAWRALPRHDRFVLSLELHGRMSIESIAALYGIHKVSAARKLARSRAVLLADVRERLRAHLGASPETVDSVLRLVTFPVSPGDLAPATGVNDERT